jgi:uncharacterized protein YkwD
MAARLFALFGALVLLTAGWSASVVTAAPARPPAIAPPFQGFYAAAGGAALFGAPVSPPFWQAGQLVQYFERARLEQPEGDQPVQLGRLGAELTAGRDFAPVAPFASTPDRWYIAETGHSLAAPFLPAWLDRGGVAILGYPISEPLDEGGRLVQYFERARLEWHPAPAGGTGTIQLGALGREAWLMQAATLAQLSAEEAELAALLNAARRENGLPALAIEPTVAALARERADDMATRHYFSHTTPEGETILSLLPAWGVPFRYAGETLQRNNFAGDQTVAEAARALLASPPHRAILLDRRFSRVGLGHAVDSALHYYAVIVIEAP